SNGDFVGYDYGTNDTDHEAQLYQGLIQEYCSLDSLELEGLLNQGENQLAIQVHNIDITSSTIDITFNLDLSSQLGGSEGGVYVAGGNEFGIPGDYLMEDENEDGIYSITITQPSNLYSYYTFINGDCGWGCKEQIGGQSCSNTNHYNDRYLEWGEEDITINACFGICGDGFCSNIPPPFNYDGLNLPIIYIDTYGENIVDDPRIPAFMGIIDNTNELNYLNDSYNDYEGNITIELRGNSSQFNPKKPYRIETVDENGENNNVSLLGMPEENDWVLYAPYQDKTLIRNVLTYQLSNEMGQYASRTRYCELFINNEYKGIYILMEKIKRDANRVDISKLENDEIIGDDLTGGYILKFDWPGAGENNGGFESENDGNFYNYHYPKPSDIVQEQEDYIFNYIHNFESIMLSPNYDDAETGYPSILNTDSFVDFILLQEISKNVDAYRLSSYIYKDKESVDDKLAAGPIWDINHGFGNCNYGETWLTDGWLLEYNPEGGDQMSFWWEILWQDDNFRSQVSERYTELRSTIFSNNHIHTIIDSITNYLGDSVDRNFDRWQLLGNYVWPNYYIYDTYDEEIDYLKLWTNSRLEWIDSQILQASSGDINNDGIINVVDVVLLVNMVLGISPNDYIADLNQDGIINVIDIVQLVSIIIVNTNVDATTAVISKDDQSLNILGDGYIGAIQIKLSHDLDFEIDLNKKAMVSEYVTNGINTKLIIVAPQNEKIFSTTNNYEIDEILVTNSHELIKVVKPFEFILNQAYPNPFNPSTNISYILPVDTHVTINIFDIEGRNITTLIDRINTVGSHRVEWNASNYPSGVYFVKLEAGEFKQTQKIMFIK
ncbi:MAG: hypothetical protein CMF96_00605, partial [Candidatus Marinimicrobia bacterium]|nr:hypothetical protein [Candidatus Neomarinimicrobiota bacterium]